ncbi:phospholipase C [Aquirhabdus sp.]|uniref:phospholipase C n=1 Tax=Aquirhabdus sp. TaxID=2824160 RepID=UPI00396C73E6
MFRHSCLTLALTSTLMLSACGGGGDDAPVLTPEDSAATTTPIKHVVVIFQENVSFDHYFGTYPKAANIAGEPAFTALAGTPAIDGLSGSLLTANPNLNPANGKGAANPFRLDRSQAATQDQNHAYPAEQFAYNNGAMDLFPKNTGTGSTGAAGAFGTSGQVMGYYDGNTVTAMWNYAQHFAMSDNSYSTTFGPSTPGAINLISGQTNGAVPDKGLDLAADGTRDEYTDANGLLAATLVPDGNNGWTVADDEDPAGDVCSSAYTFHMTGKNVGDLLNAKNISWGFFSGGFDLTQTNSNGTTGCKRSTTSGVTNVKKVDYIPHHQPFQYYASTANLNHTRPSSVQAIGTSNDGGANHQYDIHDFFDALKAGNFPAVSFLKAPGYQDGHAGYSSPLDEQQFVASTINTLQQSPEWKNTLVIVMYDDSDGWYDHKAAIVNGSNIHAANYDPLNKCTSASTPVLAGVDGKTAAQGRCGYGPRQPLLVISPYAKQNYVDHTLTDQTSTLKFIEDNWLGGQRIAGSFDGIAGNITNMLNFAASPNTSPYTLDPSTGLPQ